MTDQFKNIRTAQEIVEAVKKEREMEQQSLVGTHEKDYTVNPLPLPSNATDNPSTIPGTTEFKSGAVRSSELKGLRYDLISPVALRRLAAAYGEGADKYYAFNCEKGFPIFGDEGLFTHAFEHLMKFAWGDTTEDHLGHLLWNVAMMCHSQECWPELNAGTSRAEIVPLEKRQHKLDRLKTLFEITERLGVKIDINTSISTEKIQELIDHYNKQLQTMQPTVITSLKQQPNNFVKPGTIYGVSEHEAAPYVQPAQINQEAFLRPEVGVVQEVKPTSPIKPYPHRADIPADFQADVEDVTDIIRVPRSG
jgi:hypothetical protein